VSDHVAGPDAGAGPAHGDASLSGSGEAATPARDRDPRPVSERSELTPRSEVAREALNRAKAAARAKGLRPGNPSRRSPLAEPRKEPGKGPGARDPRLLSDVVARLLRDKGWTQDISVGGVVGRWREVVGDQVADHCTPETFEDKVLVVRADSTAWATQVRLLVPTLLRRLTEEVGEGVVEQVQVLGPAGPSFRRGRRTVRGPGPGDTYG
jgi:predicted nucleic acid-binding Zn ribbon protein